jgi:hypothetical protein
MFYVPRSPFRVPGSAFLVLLVVVLCLSVDAQETTLDGRPVFVLENDKLSLTLRQQGGSMVRLLLKDDPDQINPMHSLGHFVCVDGFGPSSDEERAAGLPMHGEANRVPWEFDGSSSGSGTLAGDRVFHTYSYRATLPLVHESFRRTIHLVQGEQVVYIDSELESLLAFDRPINWGEHATIGPPFLELGKTVVDMSATRAMTRSYDSQSANPPHRLADFKEFQWPMAPGIDGRPIDVRPAPAATPVGDHTTSLMDPSRELVYVTALHPDRRLLLGYIFKRTEFPWTQLWENYPASGRLARGLEFAVQPFDMPRRDVIQQNTLLGAPTYRWLPAQSKITASFLMFYTRTPQALRRVDDVRLENGRIVVQDRSSNETIALSASRGL